MPAGAIDSDCSIKPLCSYFLLENLKGFCSFQDINFEVGVSERSQTVERLLK